MWRVAHGPDMRVPPLARGGRALRLPLAALLVSLVSVGLLGVVPGPTSEPVVLAVGFGPTAGAAVIAGHRKAIRALPPLGLVPLLTLVVFLTEQVLRFGYFDQMVWLVSVVVLVSGVVTATAGYALGRVVGSLRAWVAD
jgi:hypothetical protein